MTIWTNSDGLKIRLGLDQAKVAREGVTSTMGEEKEAVFDLDYAALPTVAENGVFLNRVPGVIIPAGSILRSATIIVSTAFDSAGDAGTLTIGLSKPDGTVIDADGIDAAIAQTAIDAAGEEVACNGALIKTKLANDSCVTVEVDTAAFTAGRAKLILKYITPDA